MRDTTPDDIENCTIIFIQRMILVRTGELSGLATLLKHFSLKMKLTFLSLSFRPTLTQIGGKRKYDQRDGPKFIDSGYRLDQWGVAAPPGGHW